MVRIGLNSSLARVNFCEALIFVEMIFGVHSGDGTDRQTLADRDSSVLGETRAKCKRTPTPY